MGITVDDDSLVADLELRGVAPLDVFVRDPMHVLLASGSTLQVEIYLFFKKVREVIPDVWAQWKDEFSTWCTGRGCEKAPAGIFSVARRKATLEHEHLVGSATDCLAVFPFLRNWSRRESPKHPSLAAPSVSFELMCRVTDLYLDGKRTGTCDRTAWYRAVSAALRAHTNVYGRAYIKPKHHYMYHVADAPSEDERWLDAFVLERRHRLVKAEAENINRIEDLDKVVLGHTLASFLEEASAGLPDACKWWPTPELDSSVGHTWATKCRSHQPPHFPRAPTTLPGGQSQVRARISAGPIEESHCYWPAGRALGPAARPTSMASNIAARTAQETLKLRLASLRRWAGCPAAHPRGKCRFRVAALAPRMCGLARTRRTTSTASSKLGSGDFCWWMCWSWCGSLALARRCGERALEDPAGNLGAP